MKLEYQASIAKLYKDQLLFFNNSIPYLLFSQITQLRVNTLCNNS